MIACVSRIAMVVIWTSVACGSSESEPAPPACEPDGPVQLLEISESDFGEWGVATTVAADHVVANVWGLKATDPVEYISASYAIDLCGESAVELVAKTETKDVRVGTAGPWVLSSVFGSGEIRWRDPEGRAPSHVVFASAHTCAVRVADGLAVVDIDGTLWFHPDPDDPGAEPVVLAHDVVHSGASFYAEFSCTASSRYVPIAEGDALLVAEHEGSLVRIAIPSGERETIIDATVARFAVLEDPRYILWLEGIENTADCCSLQVRDREDGGDHVLGSARTLAAESTARWIATHVRDPPTMIVSTTFLDLATGMTLSVDEGWNLEAQLSESRLLVHREGGHTDDEDALVLDVATGALEPIDFPRPERTPTYADGVVGFDAQPGGQRGTLKLLPFDESGIEVLAQEVQTPYARARDGTIVFVERVHDDDDTGPLVLLRNGERHVIDTDVLHFMIPFYGSERELAEVHYIVLDPARAGLWRYVLP
jgi:hypothetical protein